MSPMQRLLIDRTLGILAGIDRALLYGNFVAVMPQLVGSQVKAWVMLTTPEFLDTFGTPQGATLQ